MRTGISHRLLAFIFLVSVFFSTGVFSAQADTGIWETVTPSGTSGYVFNTVVSMQDYVYLGTDHGVYRSTDRGATWGQNNTGLNNLNINAIVIGWTYDAGNYRYTISSSSPVFVATPSGVYRSTIDGTPWVAISATSTYDIEVDQYLVTQGDASTLYAATSEGVYRGINSDPTWVGGALVWTLQNTGMNGVGADKIATDIGNGSIFALTSDNKLYSSELYSFSSVDESWSLVLDQQATTTTDISVSNAIGQIGWLTTENGILKSDTTGSVWTLVNSGLGTSTVNAVASDYIDPVIAYAALSSQGIYRTTSEAILDVDLQIPQWLPINIGLTDFVIDDVKTNPSNSGLIYAVGANGLYRLTMMDLYEDMTPPSDVTDLVATATDSPTSVVLSWTAPGNNGTYATSTTYNIRYASSTITNGNFSSAIPVIPMPNPWEYGHEEVYTANNLPAESLYFALIATDSAGNQSNLSNIASTSTPPADVTPPVLSSGSPSGTQAAGTTQVTISLTTDETATCKYSTTNGTAYASMTDTFSTTGGTSHSSTITSLTNGTSYTYYIRCVDTASNPTVSDYTISWSVASPSSGGGSPRSSGGSSGSSNNTVAPLTAIVATTTPGVSCTLVTVPETTSPIGANASAYTFMRQLTIGSIGEDVRQLQIFLNTHGYPIALLGLGSRGQESTYFGNLTQIALRRFQEAYRAELLTPSGLTAGTGFFGPATLRKVNTLNSSGVTGVNTRTMTVCAPNQATQSVVIQPVITPATSTVQSAQYLFTRQLALGSIGLDVKALQIFLNTHGFPVSAIGIGSRGSESTYFGPATAAALARFQEAYRAELLTPTGLTVGTGFFGSATMKKVNSMK